MSLKNLGRGRERRNHHFILIEAPENIVGPEAMLWGQASWWPKKSNMRFVPRGTEPLAVGSEFRQVVLPVGPRWDVRVTKLVPNQEIERTFLNGMFIGREVVKVEGRYNGTRVTYLLNYRINGFINKILWNWKFRQMHNRNIEMILEALRDFAVQKAKQVKDAGPS